MFSDFSSRFREKKQVMIDNGRAWFSDEPGLADSCNVRWIEIKLKFRSLKTNKNITCWASPVGRMPKAK